MKEQLTQAHGGETSNPAQSADLEAMQRTLKSKEVECEKQGLRISQLTKVLEDAERQIKIQKNLIVGFRQEQKIMAGVMHDQAAELAFGKKSLQQSPNQ